MAGLHPPAHQAFHTPVILGPWRWRCSAGQHLVLLSSVFWRAKARCLAAACTALRCAFAPVGVYHARRRVSFLQGWALLS
ncbi:hypothetical protein KCP78_14350 [Salmonella enterica subsp. enterica]|nr:hypothetical protein KCP78_14350 [Salmonella enterica subsp. enterica]